MKLRHIVTVATVAFLFSTFAQAQTQKPSEPTTIRASADSTASAIADQIDVVISIYSEADTPQNAVNKCRSEFDRIIVIFRKHLDNDVKFDTPELRAPGPVYSSPNGQHVQGQFTVHLTSASAAVTSHLQDAISEANIQQPWIVCKSSQEETARKEAVKQATVKAKERAEAIASALGKKVLRIVSVEDTTPMGISTGYSNLTMPLGLPTAQIGPPSDRPGSGKGIGIGGPTSTGSNQLNPYGTTGGIRATSSRAIGSQQDITVLAIVTIVVEVEK